MVTNEQYVFFLNDLGLDYESALEYYNLIAEDSKIYFSKEQYFFLFVSKTTLKPKQLPADLSHDTAFISI